VTAKSSFKSSFEAAQFKPFSVDPKPFLGTAALLFM
jgi:hypothetical protein